MTFWHLFVSNFILGDFNWSFKIPILDSKLDSLWGKTSHWPPEIILAVGPPAVCSTWFGQGGSSPGSTGIGLGLPSLLGLFIAL